MKTRVLLLLVCFISLSCTSEDPTSVDPDFQEVRGTVVGTAACNTEKNGVAYEIEIRNINSIQKIITPNLPDEFKQEGQEISFDMEQSQEGFSICATIYSPEIFYKVYNINRDER